MAENPPNLLKNSYPYIHEAQHSPPRVNAKRSTPRCFPTEMFKDKERRF